jgi:hypothetical protein
MPVPCARSAELHAPTPLGSGDSCDSEPQKDRRAHENGLKADPNRSPRPVLPVALLATAAGRAPGEHLANTSMGNLGNRRGARGTR